MLAKYTFRRSCRPITETSTPRDCRSKENRPKVTHLAARVYTHATPRLGKELGDFVHPFGYKSFLLKVTLSGESLRIGLFHKTVRGLEMATKDITQLGRVN